MGLKYDGVKRFVCFDGFYRIEFLLNVGCFWCGCVFDWLVDWLILFGFCFVYYW